MSHNGAMSHGDKTFRAQKGSRVDQVNTVSDAVGVVVYIFVYADRYRRENRRDCRQKRALRPRIFCANIPAVPHRHHSLLDAYVDRDGELLQTAVLAESSLKKFMQDRPRLLLQFRRDPSHPPRQDEVVVPERKKRRSVGRNHRYLRPPVGRRIKECEPTGSPEPEVHKRRVGDDVVHVPRRQLRSFQNALHCMCSNFQPLLPFC